MAADPAATFAIALTQRQGVVFISPVGDNDQD